MIGNALLNAALSYAERGIPVFPCNPRDKRPLTEHGFKDATTDRTQIISWWTTSPGAMIGMPTGSATRYLVVDIDPRHGGDVNLQKLMQASGVTDHLGRKIKTGSGGQHLYYKNDTRFTIGKGDNEIAGIDHRGEGGYVIVPPSTHPSGGYYEGDLQDPDSLDVIPEWLADALLEGVKRPIETSLKGEVIPEGGRNDVLFRIGAKLRAQEWEADDILSHLLLVNRDRCKPPLPDSEVGLIARQAARYEKGSEEKRLAQTKLAEFRKKLTKATTPEEPLADPGYVSEAIKELGRQEIDDLSDVASDVQFTDAGNAEYYVEKYGANLRYVVETNRWLYWNGERWREDASKKFVLGLAEQAMRARLIELVNDGTASDKKVMTQVLSALSDKRLGAILNLAATRVPVTYYSLDSKPHLLNVQGRTLDLKTGEHRPHNPNDLMTQMAGTAYNPDAKCPRFISFLQEILPEIDIEYLKRWFGYCLTGENREKKMHIWEGKRGNNGKSTLKNVLLHVFGDYGIEVSVSVFIGKNRDYKNDDLVPLKQKRLVFAGEPEDGAILNSSLIKRMTGMDRIHCRPLHSNEWVNYEPTFKPVILTNHEMRVYDTDDAFWRRPEMVRFNQVFEGTTDNKNLINDLRAESEGILTWIVQGAMDWYNNGLMKDAVVSKETNSYRERQDIFGDFLRSYTLGEVFVTTIPIPNPKWPAQSSRLREIYNLWAEKEGLKRYGKMKFKDEMERHSLIPYHGEGGTFWKLPVGVSSATLFSIELTIQRPDDSQIDVNSPEMKSKTQREKVESLKADSTEISSIESERLTTDDDGEKSIVSDIRSARKRTFRLVRSEEDDEE
jgi:putative DNA primase/helicase